MSYFLLEKQVHIYMSYFLLEKHEPTFRPVQNIGIRKHVMTQTRFHEKTCFFPKIKKSSRFHSVMNALQNYIGIRVRYFSRLYEWYLK